MIRKKDLWLAAFAGFITAIIAVPLFRRLDILSGFESTFAGLIIVLPIVFSIGVWISDKLASHFSKISFLRQFSKFIAVGFLNTAIDFGILNILISYFKAEGGFLLILVNSVAFLGAVVNSYFWNKSWTFGLGVHTRVSELSHFVIITFIGLMINDLIVFTGVSFFDPILSLNLIQWTNLIKALGVVVSLIWNFLGYKFFVFKRLS